MRKWAQQGMVDMVAVDDDILVKVESDVMLSPQTDLQVLYRPR